MNFTKLVSAATVIAGLSVGVAHAAPVTYTFNGTVQGANISSGSLAGVFADGQAFTMSWTLDDASAPDFSYTDGSTYHNNRWESGDTATIVVNGYSYTVGPVGPNFPADQGRNAISGPLFGNGANSVLGGTVNTSPTSALTTNNAAVGSVLMSFSLQSTAFLLDFLDPRFPTAVNISDWNLANNFSLQLIDMSGGFAFFNSSFTSASVSSSSSTVPAPGALALLGFGLIGAGALRRKNRAA